MLLRSTISIVFLTISAAWGIAVADTDYENNSNPQVVDLSQDLHPQPSPSQSTQNAEYNQPQWEASQTAQSAQNINNNNAYYQQAQNVQNQTSYQQNVQYPDDSAAYQSTPPVPSAQPGTLNAPEATDTSSFSSQQPVDRLEQQVQNLVNMNMPQQISQLQQQVEQLTGQLQQDEHQIQLLKDQLKHVKVNNAISQGSTPNIAPTTSVKTPVSVQNNLPSEDQVYQTALNFLNSKNYNQAQTKFNNYLQQYPQGRFAANAHYWLGEIYLLNNNINSAAAQFSTLIAKYPSSPQISDAHLKLATIYLQQGKTDLGRKELEFVQKNYPGSTAAHLAEIQLQQLNLTH